jgi:hypothetical protein
MPRNDKGDSLPAEPDKSGNYKMGEVFENVVRGFSLVLHDSKGSHYKIWRQRIFGMVNTNLNPKLEQN